MRPKGRSTRPERIRVEFLGRGSQSVPHQLGGLGSVVTPSAKSGANPQLPQWFLAFYKHQMAFPGISKASGQAPAATFYGA